MSTYNLINDTIVEEAKARLVALEQLNNTKYLFPFDSDKDIVFTSQNADTTEQDALKKELSKYFMFFGHYLSVENPNGLQLLKVAFYQDENGKSIFNGNVQLARMTFLYKATQDPKCRFAAKRLYSFEYVLSEAKTGSSKGEYVFKENKGKLHQLVIDFDNSTESEAKWDEFYKKVDGQNSSLNNVAYKTNSTNNEIYYSACLPVVKTSRGNEINFPKLLNQKIRKSVVLSSQLLRLKQFSNNIQIISANINITAINSTLENVNINQAFTQTQSVIDAMNEDIKNSGDKGSKTYEPTVDYYSGTNQKGKYTLNSVSFSKAITLDRTIKNPIQNLAELQENTKFTQDKAAESYILAYGDKANISTKDQAIKHYSETGYYNGYIWPGGSNIPEPV